MKSVSKPGGNPAPSDKPKTEIGRKPPTQLNTADARKQGGSAAIGASMKTPS